MTSESTGPRGELGVQPRGEDAAGGEIRKLIDEALPKDSGLAPLRGFKLDLSANRGFRKFFYSARCGCGTAALLSLEVALEKTPEDVSRSLPALMDGLQERARTFYSMSCDDHGRMRGAPPSRVGPEAEAGKAS